MSEAIPAWRKMRTDGVAARITAFATVAAVVGLFGLLIAAPLVERFDNAQRRADNLDRRAAALRGAAAERLAEAEVSAPPQADIARAAAYLAGHAPVRSTDAAMLDLLSSVRLIAQASDVRLTATAPLDAQRSDARLLEGVEGAGLSVLAVEARIVADHDGVARFLTAIDQSRPVLRAASIEITSRSSRADQENERLNARILIGSIIRVTEGE